MEAMEAAEAGRVCPVEGPGVELSEVGGAGPERFLIRFGLAPFLLLSRSSSVSAVENKHYNTIKKGRVENKQEQKLRQSKYVECLPSSLSGTRLFLRLADLIFSAERRAFNPTELSVSSDITSPLSLTTGSSCLEGGGLCLERGRLCLEGGGLCLDGIGLCLDGIGLCLEGGGLCLD